MAVSARTGTIKHPSRVMVWLALWTVYIVWGSTYLAIRVTVETLPPLLTGGVRFLVAGGLMYGFLWWRNGRASLRVTAREFRSAALVGGALLLGGNGMVMVAEQEVPSGLASLIIASVPLWVILFRTVDGDRASKGTLVSVAAGFAGVGLLVVPSDRPGGATLTGILIMILAAVCWAAGSFAATKLTLPRDLFVSTALQMVLGGFWNIAGGIVQGEAADIDFGAFSTASIVALVYLVFIGSLLAFTAYVWLLQNAPISKVATYAYVNPVIAIFLGWFALGEEITLPIIAGAAIVVGSVAFIVRRQPAPAPAPAEADGAAKETPPAPAEADGAAGEPAPAGARRN